MTSVRPTLSVVVVNWNSRDDLRACLRSLEAQTDRDFEVVVVDNGSEDGSLELVQREFPAAVLLPTGENLGFAEGCNRGIEAARGEWIATLNNDAEAEPRFVEELRRAAGAGDARLGMLQARIVFRERPERTNSTGVLLRANGTAVDRAFDAAVVEGETEEEVFAPSAGAAMYRRTMLDELRLPSGWFDRTFFMYWEDVDLGGRGRLAGWTATYVPTAVVRHAFHGSASRRGKHFVKLHCARNRVRMLLKNASAGFLLRGAPRTLSDFAWALSRTGLGALPGYFEAVRDGVRQRADVLRLVRLARRDVERRWVTRA